MFNWMDASLFKLCKTAQRHVEMKKESEETRKIKLVRILTRM